MIINVKDHSKNKNKCTGVRKKKGRNSEEPRVASDIHMLTRTNYQ